MPCLAQACGAALALARVGCECHLRAVCHQGLGRLGDEQEEEAVGFGAAGCLVEGVDELLFANEIRAGGRRRMHLFVKNIWQVLGLSVSPTLAIHELVFHDSHKVIIQELEASAQVQQS